MSIRADLLNNIKDALKLITTGNGFNQTVNKVDDQNIQVPNEVIDDDFPILFLTDGDEKKEPGDVDSKKCDLEFIVTGFVKRANDADDMQSRRRDLQNDVEKAIMVDDRRGGKAISTEITKIGTDNGILDDFSLFELTGVIQYFHNRNDPNNQDNSPT